MQKLLLMSVLIACVALPIIAARDRNSLRGLKKAVFWVFAFNLMYLLGLVFLYPLL
jgi:hypothetical protein